MMPIISANHIKSLTRSPLYWISWFFFLSIGGLLAIRATHPLLWGDSCDSQTIEGILSDRKRRANIFNLLVASAVFCFAEAGGCIVFGSFGANAAYYCGICLAMGFIGIIIGLLKISTGVLASILARRLYVMEGDSHSVPLFLPNMYHCQTQPVHRLHMLFQFPKVEILLLIYLN